MALVLRHAGRCSVESVAVANGSTLGCDGETLKNLGDDMDTNAIGKPLTSSDDKIAKNRLKMGTNFNFSLVDTP